jgi:hypothetical protein
VKRREHSKGGLRVVALFEATKGALVLSVGFGLPAFIHKNLHLAAQQLVRHIHLNPTRHYPQIFIDAAIHVTDSRYWHWLLQPCSTPRFALSKRLVYGASGSGLNGSLFLLTGCIWLMLCRSRQLKWLRKWPRSLLLCKI